MTSLQETLPILDLAVPALPGKVEAVAHEADSFEKAAREAVAGFQQKRAAADALVEQVRQALEAVRDQAAGERQGVEEAARALRETTEEEAREIDASTDALRAAGGQASSAFEAVQSQIDQGGDRTRTAHGEAQSALDALDERTRSGRSGLEQAGEQMASALGDARGAISDSQAQIAEGVSALAEAMGRLLEKVQTRLDRTRKRLDELRDEQADDVADTLSGLVSRREQVGKTIATRLEEEPAQSLDPEFESLEAACGELGQQVTQLQADCQGRCEELELQLTATAERIEPLRGAVAQVMQAAEQVGIAWP